MPPLLSTKLPCSFRRNRWCGIHESTSPSSGSSGEESGKSCTTRKRTLSRPNFVQRRRQPGHLYIVGKEVGHEENYTPADRALHWCVLRRANSRLESAVCQEK